MALTPLDIRKMGFSQKLRGYDPQEVEDFLELVAEELAGKLGAVARTDEQNRDLRRRLEEGTRRQQEMQEALLHAQKLSKSITDNAKREAEILVREAQVTADNIVTQAIEQANRIEGRISELRARRRDLQVRFRNTIDMFRQMLEEDMEDERTTALVRTLPRRQQR